MLIGAQGSELRPRAYAPIEVEITNAGIITNYTFNFLPGVSLARGMNLAITFPPENYESGLLQSPCQAKLNDDFIECQVFDTVLAVIISQSPSESSEGLYSLQVMNIWNPKDPGLTGYFAFELFHGPDSKAFNDLFGQVAISSVPRTISLFTVHCKGICKVGDKHTYTFTFSLPVEIQPQDRLMALIPLYMGRIGRIQCSAVLWPRLKCMANQTSLYLDNWESTNETVAIEFPSVRTRPVAGLGGPFQLVVMNEGKSILKAMSLLVNAPLIFPNRVVIEKICPNTLEKSCPGSIQRFYPGSLLEITIYGSVWTAIPAGGVLFGNFSDDFSEIVPKSCHLISGLGTESSPKAPFCHIVSRHFRIVVTDLVPKGDFSLNLKITTSTNITGSLLVAISSDQTMTGIIALLDRPYFFPIDKTRKLSSLQALWSNEQRIGGKSGLAFSFRPSLEFTRMKKGKILVRLPTAFILKISDSPTLDICSSGAPLLVPTYTYSQQLGLVEVTLPSEFKSIPANCTSRLEVTKGISGVEFPAVTGEYAVELVLHNGFGEVEADTVWVEVKSQEFLEVSVLPLAREAGELTVLSVSFTPTVKVPKGVIKEGMYGQIVVEFRDESWAKDLGTGLSDLAQISCQAREHITAVSGKSLVCTLHHAQSTEAAYISIENFNELRADTNVLLEIGGIANPSEVGAKARVQVSTVLVKRQISTELNWAEIVLPATLRTAETGKGLRGAALLSSAIVNSVTQLRLALISNSGTSTGAEVAIIIQLPAGFIFAESGFGCKLQNKAVNCTSFPTSQLIIIHLVEKVEAKKELSLAIRGLYTPRHVVKSESLNVRLVVNNAVAEYVNVQDFPALRPGSISEVDIVPDSSEAGYADNTFYFLCYIEHPLYFGGKMRVHFPKDFDVASFTPDCSITDTRSEQAENTDCRMREGYVELDTFYVIERSPIVVKIDHIPNPVSAMMTGRFDFETLSEQFLLIDTAYGIQGLLFDPPASKPHLRITNVQTSPRNRNIMADVYLAFQPFADVPAGAVISISLPVSEYPELPKSVEYMLGGGLVGQGQCEVRGSVLDIVVERKYRWTKAAICVNLWDLTSRNAAEESGPVGITLVYKGKVINESENSPTISYSAEPLPLSVLSFNVSPKTHSERAKYRLVLHPSSDIPANHTLSLRFGAQFPRKLADPLYCISKALSNSVDGSLSCKESNRVVTLTVTKPWSRHSQSDLIITLANILNPAPGLSLGPITISTLHGESWVDSTTFTPNVTLSPVPSPMTLVRFNTSSYWTGDRANVSLQVAAQEDFSGLQLFTLVIDFPPSYRTGSNTKISCGLDTELYPCFVAFGRIYISVDSFTGETIRIINLANPIEAGPVAYPTVSLYVPESDTVLAKTVVDTFLLAPLVYQQSTCTVAINKHQLLVQNRGTVSRFLPITVKEPASHDFVLTYREENLGIQVFPRAVLMQKDELRIEFKVSISQVVLVGNYLLEWTVSGFPTCSTQQLHLQVVDRGDENFLVNSAATVVEGGSADNNAVLLLHAPAEDFALRLVKTSVWPQTVQFSPDVLHFAAGETLKTYSVVVGNDCYGEVLQYSFAKEGRNAEAYRLSAPVVSTKILPKDSTAPVITDIHIVPNRTSANVSVFTDKPALLSLMVAWRSVRPPSISELTNQTFPGNLSSSVYFLTSNSSTRHGLQSYIHRVEIVGLRAQTTHNLFVQASNVRVHSSMSIMKGSEFTTLNYHRTAYAILRFWTSRLTANDHETILKVASECLNIPPSRFLMNEDSTFPEKATLQLILISNPNDAGEIAPVRLLSRLQECSQTLKSKVPSFDNNLDIDPVEFPYRSPKWRAISPVIKLGLEGAKFENLWLDMPGTVYICLVYYVSETETLTPTSYQISQGLDATDKPCLLFITTQENWVMLTNLAGDSAYSVFVTAGNAVPGLPDLMPDSEITTFTFKLAVFGMPGAKESMELWKTMSCALDLTLSALLVLGC